jgi:hypothetical protein
MGIFGRGWSLMKQLAYPTALGCGCVCGGAGVAPVRAAEWSFIPSYSASVDYDSNRRLNLDEKSSEASVLTVDWTFKRAVETNDFYIEPRYSFRRYNDKTLGNGDDRSLFAGFDLLQETSSLNLTASIWDQSTLLTEVLETGILTGDTHRRQVQAGCNWTWYQAERRQFIAQLSFADVKYFGAGRSQLPGYRYSLGTAGERFLFSDKGSFTVSAYGNVLSSSTRGSSSHEAGVQAEAIYAFSELTNLDATVGESSRVLAGVSSQGTDASVVLKHSYSLGWWSLNYSRSLVPYGTGFLVQRQQASVTVTRNLTPYLDLTATLSQVRNNQQAVLLGLDRRSYDGGSAGLNWHPAETWSVGAQASGLQTQSPGFLNTRTVHQWRGSVTVTWTPHPTVRSW